MALSSNSRGCLAGPGGCVRQLLNQLRNLFQGRRRNHVASVQPGENTIFSQGLSQEHNNSNIHRSSNPQDGNQTTIVGVNMGKLCAASVEGSKQEVAEASIKLISENTQEQFENIQQCSDDEDVCPTCLEEYYPENPKIITKCCHHFHLSCIYEWKERSNNCPVCLRVMLFEETL